MPTVSMAEITGTASDSTTISAVGAWVASRGKPDRWRAPVHEVSSDAWKSAFAFAEPLGSGGFGTVTHASHLATGTDVAIKLVYDRTDDGKPSAKSESVRREIETMRRMDHPGIVALIEVFVHKPQPQEHDAEARARARTHALRAARARARARLSRADRARSHVAPVPYRRRGRGSGTSCSSFARGATCNARWARRAAWAWRTRRPSSGSLPSLSSTATGGAVRARAGHVRAPRGV